ncbi:MAG TPA: type II toxin-antitoxin system VapC family toxin [Candidatus Binatia bacterium]|nr:type II toxin-antitoxin system VapC family toxin [Candidatus Binatia bacterium]
MKLMLDTNICIYIIRQRPKGVLEKFTSFRVGELGISVITLAELEYGAAKSSDTARNRGALEQFVSPLEVAAFDRQTTKAYGEIRSRLEQAGRPIGAMDLLIAAHALSLNVRLVTNNVSEFQRVRGLRVETWI